MQQQHYFNVMFQQIFKYLFKYNTKCIKAIIIKLASVTASTVLRRFPQDLEHFYGMFCSFIENCEVIFSPRFLRSGNDFGREGLARSLHYSSSQRCPMGLRSGLCVSMSSSSTTNHIFMDLGLCAGAQTF